MRHVTARRIVAVGLCQIGYNGGSRFLARELRVYRPRRNKLTGNKNGQILLRIGAECLFPNLGQPRHISTLPSSAL